MLFSNARRNRLPETTTAVQVPPMHSCSAKYLLKKKLCVCTKKRKQLLVRMLLLPHHIIMIIYYFQSHSLTWKPQHNKKGQSDRVSWSWIAKRASKIEEGIRYGNVKEWESKKATLQSSTKLCRENNILQKKNTSCHHVFGTLDLIHLHE